MKTERRKHPRFTLNQLIELDFGKETFLQAEGKNISEGGILCNTKEYCAPGTRVYTMVTIDLLKEPHTMECEGVVMRSEKQGKIWTTAVNITSISDSDHRILKEYIAEQK